MRSTRTYTPRRNKLIILNTPPDIYEIATKAAADAGISHADDDFTDFVTDWVVRHVYRSLWQEIKETGGL